MSEMMRGDGRLTTVLMTTDTIGGVWHYAIELARGLGERGVRVVLAAMGDEPSSAQYDAATAIDSLVLEARPYRLEWMQDAWDDVDAAGEWLLALEASYRPDVIHLNGYAHGALPWSAPVLIVGHSCVWSWFHAVRGQAPPASWERYRLAIATGLKSATMVTAPTSAMLSELRRHYGNFASGGVAYNARRTDSLIPLEREHFVLTAGRLWDEAKNVHVLDAAAASIDWPVLAAGAVRNPDGGEVRFESVRLLGVLAPSDLGRWMGRAAIYALPARYEPFGLTALEAAHAGCALVLGDIASLREIWQDAALYVAPEDGDALAGTVNALISDQTLLEEMAVRSRRRATAFTPGEMVTTYLDMYARMLSSSESTQRDRAPMPVKQGQSSNVFGGMTT